MSKGWGRTDEIKGFKTGNTDWLYRSAKYLRGIFVRNSEELKKVNISVSSQIKDLKAFYGIQISANSMSSLKKIGRAHV